MAGTAMMSQLPGFIDAGSLQSPQAMQSQQGSQPIDWTQMAGQLSPLLAGIHGRYRNPADSAMPYLEGLPGKMEPWFTPYTGYGGNAFSHPGEALNEIGANYHQSPGFQFAMQQALQGAQHAANAGGMGGSPQHQQQAMQLASGIASQDYNNYIQNALGLQGEAGGIGANMAGQMGTNIGQNEMAKALLAYQGRNAQNQGDSGNPWLNALLTGGGAIAGGILSGGNPGGALAGGTAGSALARVFS